MQLGTILGYIVAALAIIGGFAGTVFPALPGLPLMLAGMALVGYLEDFQHLGTVTFVILMTLTIIGTAIDFFAGLFGAKATGASKQALWGAFIGGLVGIFFGIPGAILGPLIGAIISELYAAPDAKKNRQGRHRHFHRFSGRHLRQNQLRICHAGNLCAGVSVLR